MYDELRPILTEAMKASAQECMESTLKNLGPVIKALERDHRIAEARKNAEANASRVRIQSIEAAT